ncbi:calcium-binding protein [Strigomonas culicis]|nr:calcium-binding protein [Strigomonas culicis]|eukprot:EPY37264.1 calcium-binding protein [Strigomonas culicis]
MSVRMSASLYSDLVRIERGDYVTFHCELLSQVQTDLHRYFFGCYYPRWHGFYMEEVREVIGTLGRTELKHFPAFPFDVYLREDGEHYLTDDFQVDAIMVLGQPQNQRDDDVKRFKIVSVDTQHLLTKNGFGLQSIKHNRSTNGNPNTMLSTTTGQRYAVDISDEVAELLLALRNAYVLHAGGGIPELGVKAMGRPFRRVAEDGRRWMTLEGVVQLVRDSRAYGAAADDFQASRQRQADVRDIAETIYTAFPEEPDRGIDYDTFINYIRGPMSAARKEKVIHVFRRLDYDQDGLLKILDLQALFNASEHPVVVADKIFAADKLLKGFVSIWDESKRGHGTIPLSEFLDYYNGLSAVIEDDEVFFGILTTTWKLPSWSSSASGKIPFAK